MAHQVNLGHLFFVVGRPDEAYGGQRRQTALHRGQPVIYQILLTQRQERSLDAGAL